MAIKTTKVTGRRSLHFTTLDDILTDADRLASGNVQMLGNWSLGQVFQHLAFAVNGSIDGFCFRWPFFMVWGAHLMRKWYLTRGIPPGYGFSRRWDSVMPGPTAVEQGLGALRAALTRFQKETQRAPHPAFGTFTPEEWYQFHLRHAELHLSFAMLKQ